MCVCTRDHARTHARTQTHLRRHSIFDQTAVLNQAHGQYLLCILPAGFGKQSTPSQCHIFSPANNTRSKTELTIRFLNWSTVNYEHKRIQRSLITKNTSNSTLVYEYILTGGKNVRRPRKGRTNTHETEASLNRISPGDDSAADDRPHV